jgi:hypothetical protein
MKSGLQAGLKRTGVAITVAGAAYAMMSALNWYRYGRNHRESGKDSALAPFIPNYEVMERHCVPVAAPPEITFAVARDLDL